MSIDKNRIIAYLSDELSVEEKNSFEYEIKNNNELKLFLNELETNDLQLQSLIKHKTSSNFILSLFNKLPCSIDVTPHLKALLIALAV